MKRLSSRPLAVAGPLAVLGVLLGGVPGVWAAAAALPILAAALLLRSRTALLAAAALAAGAAAGGRVRDRTERALAAMPCARSPPRTASWIVDIEEATEDPFRGRAWLRARRADGVGVLCAWQGRLPDAVAAGAVVRVSGRFRGPAPPGNPGEADGRARLAARGVSVVGDLRSEANVELLRAAPPGLRRSLELARRRAARRLRALLPEDVAPVAAALVLGLRGGIADGDRVLFERTGTMHMLAISGMHLLLLAGMLHGLLRRSGAGPRCAAGVTLAAALLYVPVAGAAPPVRRAAALLVFHALALVRGRPPDPASALGGAALALSLLDPADVPDVGFRLSFAAAAGIAYLAPPWRERWGARHRFLARFPAVRQDRPIRLLVAGFLVRSAPVAVAAWCVTQPLVAQSFGLVTPLAPATNLVAGPLLALVLPPAALLAAGLDLAAPPVVALVRGLRLVLERAAVLPGACFLVPPPPTLSVVLCLLACVLLGWRAAAALPALAAGVAAALLSAGPTPPGLFLLDVGHGQAALLRFPDGAAILVDGGSRGRRDVGRRVLVPALRALGVRRLDAVVCTHADADHWNGLPDLLSRLPVDRLVAGADAPGPLAGTAARFGVRIERARAGLEIHRAGPDRLTVLAADGSPPARNDRSVALLLEMSGRAVLLPADREERGLLDLARRGVPRCEVLVAPHHGGRCALAPALAFLARPRWLLVSGPEGFADAATLRAYGARHVRSTGRDGCLSVLLSAGGIEVRGFRDAAEDRATIRPP